MTLFPPVVSMSQDAQNNKYTPVTILAISFLLIFLLFIWQGNKGFTLWDEGFLWYGVQRVLLGEVPIRDFMAYDPGRYYWSAALLSIFGDYGIMSVRAAVAIFQALGLFVGLILIAQSEKSESKYRVIFLVMSAVILAVWMFPRHKLFDISLSIFLIGILTFLVRNPIPKRYVIAGTCVGLVAVFGRNHGVYGAAGSLGVVAWLTIKNRSGLGFLKGFVLWGAGVVVGYIPVILMGLLIPGFAISFWESIRFLFELKATNLPVPWPWMVNFTAVSVIDAARSVYNVLVGFFFIGTLVFGGLAVAWVVHQRLKEKHVPPALVATAFLALPYAHHAFSRADVGHLAQGIFPLLVGCLVILSSSQARIKWPLVATLCAASFGVMLESHPGLKCLAKQCVNVEISGSNLQIGPGKANNIALLRQLSNDYAPNGQAFIAAPFWPGAYALLERRSPMWEIYALFPRPEAFEKKEIERIKVSKPRFAFIFDFPLDGRDELRFKNTHPLIHQYILNNFEPLPSSHNPAYQIYKARDALQ